MKTRLWILILIMGGTIGCDRVTKSLARSTLQGVSPQSFLHETLRLEYVENEGAFLGLGGKWSRSGRFWLFTVGNGVLLLWIGLWIWRSRAHPVGETLGLALIWSGGVGNFIDRILLSGRVVDFLNVGIGPVRTGIFNVADVAIVIGVALLVLRLARRALRRSRPISV